jgi:hypothetical protein
MTVLEHGISSSIAVLLEEGHSPPYNRRPGAVAPLHHGAATNLAEETVPAVTAVAMGHELFPHPLPGIALRGRGYVPAAVVKCQPTAEGGGSTRSARFARSVAII